MSKNFNEDNVRVAAYYIWEQAGRPEGSEKDCWIKACEQLFGKGKKEKAVAKKEPAKVAVKIAKPIVKKVEAKAPAKVAAKPVAKVTAKPVAKAEKPAAGTTPFYGKK